MSIKGYKSLVGPIPYEDIQAIIAYNWEDEQRDYDESIERGDIEPGDERHIYVHLRRVRDWIEQ